MVPEHRPPNGSLHVVVAAWASAFSERRRGPEEARCVFGPTFESSEESVWVGLNSLAIGDLMACEFAQGGLNHIRIIIDDLVVLEQNLTAELAQLRAKGGQTWGAGRVRAARAAYGDVGLETNPKKGFVDAPQASFWGVDLDGEKGILRSANS